MQDICARIKWNALPKIWIEFRVLFVFRCFFLCLLLLLVLVLLCMVCRNFQRNDWNQIATTMQAATWRCAIRNVPISFTHIQWECSPFYCHFLFVSCARLSTHFGAYAYRRWSTCTSTHSAKQTKRSEWKPKWKERIRRIAGNQKSFNDEHQNI